MKVGIDVLETSRVKTDVRFLKSFLNESEIEYVSKFEKPTERIVGLFCAKEAVFKALCEKQFSPHNITISHDETGRPKVVLRGKYLEQFYKKFKSIDLSISHSKTIATAICLAEEK